MGRQERLVLPTAVQEGEEVQDRLRALLRSILGAIPPVEGVWAGTSGVRIKFRRKVLLDAVNKVRGLRHGEVQYLKLKELNGSFKPERLPFLKRYGFLGEDEYRLVYGSDKDLPKFDIDIPPDCIESVKLNPWLNVELFEHVKNAIRKVDSRWKNLEVVHSSLIDNERWRDFADRVSKAGV